MAAHESLTCHAVARRRRITGHYSPPRICAPALRPPPSAFTPEPRERPRAFTLLEMLVVIGIIVVILAFSVPAITGLSKSGNLNTGGRIISNLLTAARSEAINRRALIRFEVATSWPNDFSSAYRKITLVQHDVSTGSDTQLTRWETLPTGTIFQPQDPSPGSGSYFFALNQTQTPALKIGGQDVTTLYIEFLPTGALNVTPANSPVRLRLVPGFLPSVGAPSVTMTSAANWFDMSVDGLVGRIKISRP
jgi:prepilin-type N-terminal cleavage/methylation domain-containing protein